MIAAPGADHDGALMRLCRGLENKRVPAGDYPACDQKDTALLALGLREWQSFRGGVNYTVVNCDVFGSTRNHLRIRG